jgi:predicted lipid-binding transport protein (Tim44 family)
MNPNPAPQPPSGGGFFRNFGAGLAGGFLGSMLFRSFGGGGYDTGGGGGGFGFLELILLVGILFMAFRFFRNRMQPAPDYQGPMGLPTEEPSHDSPFIDKDTSLDIFFRVQSAYMNRDLTPIRDLMTSEVNDFLQRDVDALLASHQIDKLENIAVRDAEVVEQWQEEGKDWATVHFTANVIDYTIDERTQEVISGSKTTSVKFEEYWTLVRPSGSGPSQWKLSAIQQK